MDLPNDDHLEAGDELWAVAHERDDQPDPSARMRKGSRQGGQPNRDLATILIVAR